MEPCGLLKNRTLQNQRLEIVKQLDKMKHEEVISLLLDYCNNLEPTLKKCSDEYVWRINGVENRSTCIYYELIMSNVLLINTIVDNLYCINSNKNKLLAQAVSACKRNLLYCKQAQDFIRSTPNIVYLTPVYNLDKLDYCYAIKTLNVIENAELKDESPDYGLMGKVALEAVHDLYYQRHKYSDDYKKLLYYLYTYQARHLTTQDQPTKAIALLVYAKPMFKQNVHQAEMFDVLIQAAQTNNTLISNHESVSLNEVSFAKLTTHFH